MRPILAVKRFAGLLGQVSDVHVWHPAHSWPNGVDRPDSSDPIPEWLDWDAKKRQAVGFPEADAIIDPKPATTVFLPR